MSARHLQKPKQINLKDGTVGSALLVTLALVEPTSEPLSEESHVPSASYTAPQSNSTERVVFVETDSPNLLNSVELLRHDPSSSTSQSIKQQTSLKVNCLLQIIQARYVEKKGIPLVPKRLGELYTSAELIDCKDSDLLNESPQGHPDDENVLVATVDKLMKKSESEERFKWIAYRLLNNLCKKPPGTHGHLHEYFHAAQWLFANASPEFFDENQREFTELSTLIEGWADMCLEESRRKTEFEGWSVDGVETSVWYLTSDAFRRLKAYFLHQHRSKLAKARLSLLNSAQMLRRDHPIPTTPQPVRQWISLRINCFLQIAQASLVERFSSPLKPKPLGELYTPAELVECANAHSVRLAYKGPEKFALLTDEFVNRVRYLLAALDKRDKAEWTAYENEHKLEKRAISNHGFTHRYFHAAQWLFAKASPEFLSKHQTELAELSTCLEVWVRKFFTETKKRWVPNGWSLVTDVINTWDLTSDVVQAFDPVDFYLENEHRSRFPIVDDPVDGVRT
eukprot:Blabericola_migrator_1__5444@NODE_2783_length_2358_cov_23_251419_g1745_i0_p1_GENE_NODE_2783_length_2358_cov_23_251419_g1745_i0NODE_2783_length_2358_cov_23_251419_g1745_i0_p1_ORF_typecomplete_len510_score74_86DUF2334/PF10096_9/46DUF2334/PF10096_9/2_5DUF2268/PF10026_9/0_97DUF2268/PF10026_9/2_6e02_NODE_2783_length_2358_cov_23_251419_g1745_i07832312